MLILPEVIGTGWLGVKDTGKDLGDVGAEAGVEVLACLLLVVPPGGSLAAGDDRIEGGGLVLRTQVIASAPAPTPGRHGS